MLLRLPRLFPARLMLTRLLTALLLVAAGLQATAPMAAPLERTHGSAFSASTHEVALTAPRRGEPARHVLAPEPLVPPSFAPVRPAGTGPLPRTPPARPDSTGPPAREILALRPAPRAPPAA